MPLDRMSPSSEPASAASTSPETGGLKPQTLMIAIQCVAARTRAVVELLDADGPDATAELEQWALTLDLAASDLRDAYLAARARHPSLPDYDLLAAGA